jgi:hypothetical protein
VTEELALFEVPEPEPAQQDLRTDGERRRARHLAAMRRGQHPLSVALRYPIRLHAEAAPPEDRDAPGLRCGDCRFRRLLPYHNRTYAKCCYGDPPGERVTHGSGTDTPAWWPACREFELGDGLSEDAARWSPTAPA